MRPLSIVAALLALLATVPAARAATLADKACDFSKLNDKLAICDISNANVSTTYGCWSMARGGSGAPTPRAVKPGDVFGVQFFNPLTSKKAYRVKNDLPLVFNATADPTDANGLVDPDSPVAVAWEFLSAVLPKQKTMKEQEAKVDGAAQKAVRRAKLDGIVRELERPAFVFQQGISQVFADNPCWRADLALQPGERLVCALCFSSLKGPFESVSFGPRALREGEAAREVVGEAPGGAGAGAAAPAGSKPAGSAAGVAARRSGGGGFLAVAAAVVAGVVAAVAV